MNNIKLEDSSFEFDEDTNYFGGIYIIWDGLNIILMKTFIYNATICPNEYTADKLLLEYHRRDFQKNRFSELNERIEDFNNIELSILDSYLFNNDESYSFIDEVLNDRLEMFKKNNDKDICKTKDAYNMSDLLEALNEIVFMDNLFGSDYNEKDEDDEDFEIDDYEIDDLTKLTKKLFF